MNEISKRLFAAMSNPCLKDSRKPSTSHYPSSVSVKITGPDGEPQTIGTCLRQQYYFRTESGVSDHSPIEYSISAMQGEKNHELIEQLLDTYGFQMGMQKIAAEHSIYDEMYDLSGRSDLLVWDYKKNQMAGIEVKSVGDYKASKTILEPDPTHILQSIIYLDHYRRCIPVGQVRPERWYILYIARNESYHVKKKSHGSPFEKLWDFCIELNDQDQAVCYHNTGVTVYKDYSLDNIYARYKLLSDHLEDNTLPDRDFIRKYSEEKIAGLHKVNMISRKPDREKIDKWLAAGAKAGQLKLELGDIECQFCPFQSKCWDSQATVRPSYKLPVVQTFTPAETTNFNL